STYNLLRQALGLARMNTYGPTVAGQLHHWPYTVDTVATEYFRAHQQFIRAHRALDYRFALRCQPVHQVIAHDTAYAAQGQRWRSEEHTSELQSRENLVCRLLLEKKNQCSTT